MQIVHHRDYAKLASRQHRLVEELSSERGIIYFQDRNGELIPIALNKIEKTLVAVPREIENPETAAQWVAENFAEDQEEIFLKISAKEDPYEILVKKIDAERGERLKNGLPQGLHFEEEARRAYPYGTLGAHLAGFVSREGVEEEGRYGLERFYEQDLSGQKGFLDGVKDAAGFWVALGRSIIRPPKNGSALVLTADYNIQLKAEEVLERTREKWDAASGMVLVMDPSSGQIRALAGSPSFDPNNFSNEKNFSVFLDNVTESMYELGSVVKPLTMAAGIEDGVVGPDTVYEDSGEVKIGGYTIKNFDGRANGIQTMTQVLEKSLNTGVMYVARLLGRDRHLEYLERFGLGQKTKVDLPGEVSGDISNLESGSEIDYLTASFGQGIAVTPLQLAYAIGAIANHGNLMRPYAVERIVDDSGNAVQKNPEVVRRVISPATAEKITKMLVSAVRSGFENRAGVKGYFVAGKTGTAQIPKSDGRGYSDKVIHTFVGYAPAFDPKFLVLLQLNEPQGNRFAANTLTPAFHDLAEYILNYYEIPPDEK